MKPILIAACLLSAWAAAVLIGIPVVAKRMGL